MKTPTSREWMLATAAVVLLAAWGTFRWIPPRRDEWRRWSRARVEAQHRQQEYTRLLEMRPRLEQRLLDLRARLPVYETGRDVSSELLRSLERLAAEHGVSLLRRDAGKEREVRDLRQQAVTCQWEANLSGLVRLLFALQSAEGMPDVSQLSINPAPAGGGMLRGTMTVEYLYFRGSAARTPEKTAGRED